MPGMDTTHYRFHHYRLLPSQRQLLNGEHPVKLGSRAFDMLVALVERRDRVVPKHELMDLVWPKLVVEENNLQVQVLTLRKLLGHGAIATVPGRGYRFTLPLQGDAQPAANRPAPPTAAAPGPSLIGRADELRALQGLLLVHTLVTVSGAGGIGKTRLAQAAARSLQPPQDLAWVDLVGLDDAAALPAAVAQALGIELAGAADAGAALTAALRGRTALLVLDNAEHLLDAVAAFVATLRDQSSTLRVLVTSQEVLRLADEQVFRPGPLTLPATDDLLSVRASAAVELFVARARQVDRHFELGEHNRAAVAEVCRRLDGIPLAIELAAARVALLGVEGVRDRLDERFELLTAGARAAMRRHQTLRAALEWSHGLLTPDEQCVLGRLGVLAGGFTLEAAQEVAKDDENEADSEALDGWDVLERLGALVDKSLVVAEGTEGDAVPRYRLLETTRMFALERLAEAGETEATLLRHARCFTALAERCDAEIHAQGQGAAALARLDPERDNLLHALRWCERGAGRGGETAEVGLRLLAALRYYWPSRGLLSVGAAQALRSLAVPTSQPVTPARLQVLASAVQLHGWTGQTAEAARLAQELLAAARDAGSADQEARAMVMLGHQAADADRCAEAENWMQQALEIARHLGHRRLEAAALNGLIVIATARGDHPLAAELGQQTLAHSRGEGQSFNLCTNLLNVAIATLEAGQPAAAREYLLEAAPLVPGTGSRFLKLLWLQCVLTLLSDPTTWPQVVRLHAAGAVHAQSLQIARHDQLDGHMAGHLAAARNALGDAALDAAWSEGEALDLDDAREQALALLQARQ